MKKKKSFLAYPIWNLIVWTAAAAPLLGHWMPPRQALGLLQTHSKPLCGAGATPTLRPPLSNPTPSSRLVPILWWQLLAGPREAVILYITTNRGGPLTNRPA